MITIFAGILFIMALTPIPLIIFVRSENEKVSTLGILAFTILFGICICLVGVLHEEALKEENSKSSSTMEQLSTINEKLDSLEDKIETLNHVEKLSLKNDKLILELLVTNGG
jgi:uncharacterized membrane protein YeiB